jgi:hypothetical protein
MTGEERGVFSSEKLTRNPVANFLGLQVFRVALARFLSRRRRRRHTLVYDRHQESLISNGFCIIPGFLSPPEFGRLRKEFHAAFESETGKKVIRDSKNYIRETVYVESSGATPEAYTSIHANSQLRELLRTPESIPVPMFPKGEFQVAFWRSYPDPERNVSAIQGTHTNSELHSDTFHTITKAFFYIEPVMQSNGAHRYAPHSHRLSFRRLWFEYCNSILQREGSPRVSERQRKFMNLAPLDFELPANTIIVENTFGFHGAGTIDPGQRRDLVYVQFRWPHFKFPGIDDETTTIETHQSP